jgi:transcriptional regulator with XRE-family HTH domain
MLGDTIKKIRMLKDMTGQQLADLIGIDRGYLSNIENNIALNPAFDIVSNICDALSISLDEFRLLVTKDNITIDIFEKIFNRGYNNINLLDKEKLLKDVFSNKYLQDIFKVYEQHILSL